MAPQTITPRAAVGALAAAALVVLAAAQSASAHPSAGAPVAWSAAAHECGSIALREPRTDDGAFDIRVRGATCRRARAIAKASAPLPITSGPYTYRKLGFTCTGTLDDGPLPGVDWACRRGRAAVTFSRS